jgi:arsenate reductase
MAEGFARAYGDGVWEVESAGLMPAAMIAALTKEVMEEKGISLEGQHPKPLEWVEPERFDLIVNMSGCELPPELAQRERRWEIEDPIGQPARTYRKVRDQIEERVLGLLDELRGGS